jgi:anion-transporting  ArsA/GET3 family ATPase
MEEGFRVRADAVLKLLGDDRTAFVVVTSPRRDAVEEATFFADRLADARIEVDALVVNRLHPRFGVEADLPGSESGASGESDLGVLSTNLADFRRVSEGEEQNFALLARRVAPALISRVPFLASDVHDLDGLALVEHYLFPEPRDGHSPTIGTDEPAEATSSD